MNKKLLLLVAAISIMLFCLSELSAQYVVSLPEHASFDKFSYVIEDIQTTSELKNISDHDKPLVPPESWKVITLITVRLEAKTTGAPYLSPAIFFIEEDFAYRVCQALRYKNKDGKWIDEWQGLSTEFGSPGVDTILPWQMKKGDELYLQLAFIGGVSKGQRILVAKPIVELMKVSD